MAFNEETILFDIGNGSKTRQYLKEMYGTYGLRIVDDLCEHNRITLALVPDRNMVYHTYYNLAR